MVGCCMIRLRVKEIVEAKNISMAKLSRMADLSYNTIQAVCKQPESEITTTTLDKIATALNVHPSDLIEYFLTHSQEQGPTKGPDPA